MADMLRRIKQWLRPLIKSILAPFAKNRVYSVKYGDVDMRVKVGVALLGRRRTSTPEERFLSGLDLKGKTVYDVGSHVGIMAIFFARSVGPTGKVIAFEPNPESFLRANENLKLNGVENARVLNTGIGGKQESRSLVYSRFDAGVGSMDAGIQSEVLRQGRAVSACVPVDTLDHCIRANGLPVPDLIKLDVEGMECEALQGMAETIKSAKPSLFIEIHGADLQRKTENSRRVMEFVRALGYAIVHVESGQTVQEHNCHIAAEGHLYCK